MRNHLGVREVLVADKSAVVQRILHRAGLDPVELGIVDDLNRAEPLSRRGRLQPDHPGRPEGGE